MTRVATAAIWSVVAAAVTLAILWIITLITNVGFAEAITKPAFWLVQSATIALTAVAILSPPAEESNKTDAQRVAAHTAWTAGGAVAVGALLAIATDRDTIKLLTNIKFLIPATIAVAIAALEAWPDADDQARN